ncbi:MAG: hypothetical protein HDR32_07875 [Treponema sp.]|nr:hypothetical protein [Treponema sp.]
MSSVFSATMISPSVGELFVGMSALSRAIGRGAAAVLDGVDAHDASTMAQTAAKNSFFMARLL